MRGLPVLLLVLGACQDYNLQAPSDDAGKYNPPDLVAEKHVDEITQVTVPAVDVLFVIDNSCSMEEEQRALRDNFPDFMRYFTGSGLDYHVGVASTDVDAWNADAGRLIEEGGTSYIDSTMPADEAVESFRSRSSLGTAGSADEKGKDAAWGVLVTNAADDDGFYREEADISIVVISDERDYSDISVNEFASWMMTLKPEGSAYFSSIVGPDDNSCRTAERGTGYLEVTERVGGIAWDICTSDWSGLLTELGLQAAGLKREFFLSLVPVEPSIEVAVVDPDGVETAYAVDTNWTYDRSRNSITFVEYTPVPLSVVRITYDVLAESNDPAIEEAPGEDTAAE